MGMLDFLKKRVELVVTNELVSEGTKLAVVTYARTLQDGQHQLTTVPRRIFAVFYCTLFNFVDEGRASQRDIMWYANQCVCVCRGLREKGAAMDEDLLVQTVLPFYVVAMGVVLTRRRDLSLRRAYGDKEFTLCMDEIHQFDPFIRGTASVTIKAMQLATRNGQNDVRMFPDIDIRQKMETVRMNEFATSEWRNVELKWT